MHDTLRFRSVSARTAAALLAVTLVTGCGGGTTAGLTPASQAPEAAQGPGDQPAPAQPTLAQPTLAQPTPGATGGTACPTAGNTRRFAKTRFALHAGLALGAFHRYIYKPLRSGGFREGAEKRKRTFAKAAVAGLFALHELKVAKNFAEANPTLCKGVAAVSNSFSALTGKLKGGNATPADLNASKAAMDNLRNSATKSGFGFKEQNVTVPGAG
ncbi:hypothetical protein [Nonomuraea phyllanthi]|uniref:hypothetical protein n=1 Tax=Nonomuraea phyllanthi TaxID=2219224 RepID=UPI00186B4DEC|nr:hypothetical protein [Nonomuraea phyllanthi]